MDTMNDARCGGCGASLNTIPGLALVAERPYRASACADCVMDPLSLMTVFWTRAGQTHDYMTWLDYRWVVVPVTT